MRNLTQMALELLKRLDVLGYHSVVEGLERNSVLVTV